MLTGVVFNILQKFGIPRLPGDIFIQKDGFTFYFPIVTSIIVSILLTIILNMLRK